MNDNLTHLKRQMKRYRITQARVAAVYGVTPTMVNKVVNGRAKSGEIVRTIHALITTHRELERKGAA